MKNIVGKLQALSAFRNNRKSMKNHSWKIASAKRTNETHKWKIVSAKRIPQYQRGTQTVCQSIAAHIGIRMSQCCGAQINKNVKSQCVSKHLYN